MKPLISVLMPVYNGEDYLVEAIDSILAQTATDFEFLIMNDGSTDKTEEIILSYTDPRIKYHKNEVNLKLIKTLNKGLGLVSGKYLARMDADDISLPTRFEVQLKAFEADKDLICCGTAMVNFDDTTGFKQDIMYSDNYEHVRLRMLFGCHIAHPTATFDMDVIRKHKLEYDARYVHCEDHHFFYQIAKLGKLINVPNYVHKHRVHANSITQFYKESLVATHNGLRVDIFEAEFFKLTDEEKRVYCGFIMNRLDYTLSEVETLLTLFDKVIELNNAKQLYQASQLNKYFEETTLSILNRSTHLGMPLYNLAKRLKMLDAMPGKAKFMATLLAKSVIKKQYPAINFSKYD